MRNVPLPLILLISCLGFTSSCAKHATEAQPLFNGKDFSGWRFFSPQAQGAINPVADIASVCKLKPDGSLSVMGKPNGYLVTTAEYENYRLTLEWRWLAPKSNGGVLLHLTGPDKLWPTSMQFQMKIGAVGEWIPMGDFKLAEPLPEGAKSIPCCAPNSEKPVGQWNSAEIICNADKIECRVNGVLLNRATRCKPAKGAIGIQLEGAPFELKNVVLTPLPPSNSDK